MASACKINIRRTPRYQHPYRATMRGEGAYGWGNTPDEARACLMRQIEEQVFARSGIKPGIRVSFLENVGEVIAIKSREIAAIRFIGRTGDGRFGQMKGGCDALIKNLKPL